MHSESQAFESDRPRPVTSMRLTVVTLITIAGLLACTSAGPADTIAPAVTGRTPAPGATEVAATTPVEITFSEAIDPATINASTAVLAVDGGVVLAANRSLSADGKTLVVTPVEVPPVPSTLVMTLTAGIKDLAGNALAQTSWSWSLPAWLRVGGPVTGATRSLLETTASLAFDATGRPVVAYSALGKIEVRVWTGAEWAPLGPQPLNYSASWFGYRPVVARSGTGLVATWHEWVSGSVKNVFAKRWNGTSWTLENGGTLSYDSSNDSNDPVIASAGGLDAIAWSEYTTGMFGSNSDDILARRWDGSAWQWTAGAPDAVWSNPARRPALAIDSAGNLYVTWHEQVGTIDHHVYVRRAAAPNYAGWIELDGDNTTPNPLDRDQAQPALNPAVLIRAGDVPAVAWQEWEVASGGYVVLVAEWNGSSWSLIGGGKVNAADTADHPSLTTDSAGRLVVAYRQRASGSPADLLVSRYIGGAWSELSGPLDIVTADEIGVFPKLATSPAGVPYAVWAEGDSTDGYAVHVKRYNQ